MGNKKDAEAAAAVAESPKPTIGRIVHFTDPEGKVSAAIVTELTPSGDVHVCAFDSTFGPRNYVTNGEGTEPGNWQWPPRD